MEVLCLRLENELSPADFEIWLDDLCAFSPRTVGRDGRLAFLEISTVCGVFGGNLALLHLLREFQHQRGQPCFLGLAPTAPWAEVMTHFSTPLWQTEVLCQMPLSFLYHLQGLQPLWERAKDLKDVLEFFESLGFESLSQLTEISLDAFRGRWRAFGERLYHTLHQMDRQIISARTPREPLQAFQHFEEPLGHVPWLLKVTEDLVGSLFKKMHRRNTSLRKLNILLHLEYSNQRVSLDIEPLSANRNLALLLDLVSAKVEKLSLQNPVRQIEIFVHEVDERTQQLDFLCNAKSFPEKLERLLNIAHQENVEIGFLQIEDAYLPERNFSLRTDFAENSSHSAVSAFSLGTYPHCPQIHPQAELLSIARSDLGIAPKEWYGAGFFSGLRPSLLLPKPLKLSRTEARFLQKRQLTVSELIGAPWFEGDFSERRYFFALNDKDQIVWAFENRHTGELFLHGYWD